MNGALAHPLVQKILRYQLAMARGDAAEGRTVFHDDVEYIVPGSNLFSGTYRGPDEVMGYFGRLMAATEGTYAMTAMNWLVCGEKVLLETVNLASRKGKQLQWEEAILFEFREEKKSRIDMFQADQGAVDQFFAA
jgi:ketosteroid isomerase-like protein